MAKELSSIPPLLAIASKYVGTTPRSKITSRAAPSFSIVHPTSVFTKLDWNLVRFKMKLANQRSHGKKEGRKKKENSWLEDSG